MTSRAAALAERLTAEVGTVDSELAEVDLLIGQARTEAGRHETRRAASMERLTSGGAAPDLAAGLEQISALTRRAAFMEAQVEILEAKRRALVRLREMLAEHAAAVAALKADADAEAGVPADGEPDAIVVQPHARLILTAQEDLRREIARAMHDGPAQSLTNIVLQAQIVEHLIAHDPGKAAGEVTQLVAMVQQTLEATKTFIFDVRPMVLDDLGLMPTLRRATRERGQRAGVAIEFESLGAEHRLPVDLESALFRTIDEALVAYIAAEPERIVLHLDWGDELVITVSASRAPAAVPDPDIPPDAADLPPALAEMVESRRRAYQAALEASRRAAVVALPPSAAREARARAATHGFVAELGGEGDRLVLRVPLGGVAEP